MSATTANILKIAAIATGLIGGGCLMFPEHWRHIVGGGAALAALFLAASFYTLERYFFVTLLSAFVSVGPALALDLPDVNIAAWFGRASQSSRHHAPATAEAVEGSNTTAGAKGTVTFSEGLKQLALVAWIICAFLLIREYRADQRSQRTVERTASDSPPDKR